MVLIRKTTLGMLRSTDLLTSILSIVVPLNAVFGAVCGSMSIAEPVTLALIGIGLGAAGTGISAVGSIQQGKSAKAAGEFNARVAENDAMSARQQAEFDVERIRDVNRRISGSQAAAITKSGVKISGSSSDVMYDSSVQGELDVMSRLFQGRSIAEREYSRAKLSRFQGSQQKKASQFQAGASILTGAGQAAYGYATFKN